MTDTVEDTALVYNSLETAHYSKDTAGSISQILDDLS
jgi:hypothetical protein